MKVEFCVSTVVNIMMKEAVICNFKQQLVQWNGMVYLHREIVQSNFCNSAVIQNVVGVQSSMCLFHTFAYRV